jgi:hypothetical protein
MREVIARVRFALLSVYWKKENFIAPQFQTKRKFGTHTIGLIKKDRERIESKKGDIIYSHRKVIVKGIKQ